MTHSLETLLTRLAKASFDGPVFNQYATSESEATSDSETSAAETSASEANAIRRSNLRLYLDQMTAARPALLLVGEAPGYRGCRLTGVPFTSEAILLDDQIWSFGRQAGYQKTTETTTATKEATATMVWSAVAGIWPPPLMWNAFPFHPHRPGQPMSNRRPPKSELLLGAEFLSGLLALFPLTTVAAVGRSAAAALALAGQRDYHKLRHPSHGGKAAFCAGLQEITAPG